MPVVGNLFGLNGKSLAGHWDVICGLLRSHWEVIWVIWEVIGMLFAVIGRLFGLSGKLLAGYWDAVRRVLACCYCYCFDMF